MIHENIYSKRLKKQDDNDPYIYDFDSEEVVNSFMMLLSRSDKDCLIRSLVDFCETKRRYISKSLANFIIYKTIYDRETALFDLEQLLLSNETEDILDFLDIHIAVLKIRITSHPHYYLIDNLRPFNSLANYIIEKDMFVSNLNSHFEHNKLGYTVVNDVISTKESDYLHQEVIAKPLTLLINEEFHGATGEFTNAVDYYTKKEYENCVIEACKAYESTIKSILDKRKIPYNSGSKINVLIGALKDAGLFDSFLDALTNNLTTILTSSINTIRNKKSGHGDGLEANDVERSYASFALNLSGSCIVFLIDKYYEVGGAL